MHCMNRPFGLDQVGAKSYPAGTRYFILRSQVCGQGSAPGSRISNMALHYAVGEFLPTAFS